VLPFNTFSTQEMIEVVQWIQAKNHRAYLSHRKKKLQTDMVPPERGNPVEKT
jgi:hypothetical protein